MVDGVMSKFLKRVEGGRAAARFALLERGPAHTARAARAARRQPKRRFCSALRYGETLLGEIAGVGRMPTLPIIRLTAR
jgi:hypothetical protein